MRKFGVEIECMVPHANRSRVCPDIVAAGIPCRDNLRYHSGVDHINWKIEGDGSLQAMVGHSTMEVIAPPRGLSDQAAAVIKVCEVLNRHNAQVNKSCGLHITVDVSDMRVNAMRKLAELYADNEPLFDQLIPPSRRGNANLYTRSVAATINRTKLAAATTVSEVAYALNGNEKYFKLNMSKYSSYGTVEFRHHSGTVDGQKIVKWMELCSSLVECAKREADVPVAVPAAAAPALTMNRYWRSGRQRRLLYSLLQRPEGVTTEEFRIALGVPSRPGIRHHLASAGAPTASVGRRNRLEVFRVDIAASVPVPTVGIPTTLDDLWNKLQLSDQDREYWRERARILASTPAYRRRAS